MAFSIERQGVAVNLRLGATHEGFKYVWGRTDFEQERLCFERQSVDLTCARRDRASFQVLVQPDAPATVAVTNNPAFSPRGALPGLRLAVSLEGFMPREEEVPPETPLADRFPTSLYLIGLMEDDDRLYRAEILLSAETRELSAGEVQPVWVEVTIPAATPAGRLHGRVRVFEHLLFGEETEVGSVEFEVDIRAVTLPAPGEGTFFLDLWQHCSNLARKHEVELWSEEHFEVLERYVQSLAALGQKAATVIASEIPWSGQTCFRNQEYPSNLYEYSMIRVRRAADGTWQYDFTIMDRYVSLCLRYGMAEMIEVLGLANIWLAPEEGFGTPFIDYPDGVRIRYWDEAEGVYRFVRHREDFARYLQALEAHFVERDWIERVRLAADEPSDMEKYAQVLEFLRQTAPRFKFSAALNHADFVRRFSGQLEDFVPALECVAAEEEALHELKESLPGRFLFYVCCGPQYPNNFLRSPLAESRLMGWIAAWTGLDGFLRWDYTVWPEHPRERISYNYPGWSAGDTCFVYPSNSGRPLLTLRYKALQRGIQDFELIQQLRRRHPEAEAQLAPLFRSLVGAKQVRDLLPPAGAYSKEWGDYDRARQALLELLEALG